MPGAQPRRDVWQKLAASAVRKTAAKAPGATRVVRAVRGIART